MRDVWKRWLLMIVGTVSGLVGILNEVTGHRLPSDIHIGRWVVNVYITVALGALFLAMYLILRARGKQLATHKQTKFLEIECGNVEGEFENRWHGAGAVAHPALMLLKVRNPTEEEAKRCRVRAVYDNWDPRFGAQPRSLPWFDNYDAYQRGVRPHETNLAPHDGASVVVADQAEDAYLNMKLVVEEAGPGWGPDEMHEACNVEVQAWAEGFAPTKRLFHLTWAGDNPNQPYQIDATDGKGPCVDYPLLGDAFLGGGETKSS